MKKKGGVLKWIIIAVIVFIVIGIVVGETDKPKKVAENGKNVSSDSSTDGGEKSTDEEIYKVGDTIELKGIKVTFDGVEQSKGSDYNKPGAGNVFVLPKFTIENNSGSELNMSTVLSFDAYYDDTATSLSLGAIMEAPDNMQQLDGTIAAGKKMVGVVGYEVPKNYKKFEVNVQLDVWSDQKIKFVYNKK